MGKRKTRRQTRKSRGGSLLQAIATAIVSFGLIAAQKRRQNGRSIKKMYRRV